MRIIDLFDDSMFDISEIVRTPPAKGQKTRFSLKISHKGLSESVTLSARDFNGLEDELEKIILNYDSQWKQKKEENQR